jgi:uncharacterized protein
MKIHPIKIVALLLCLMAAATAVFASDKDFPAVQTPPRLVNDFAHFMDAAQAQQLEARLLRFADTSSNQIAIVTVESIGPYDIADYSVELFNRWKIGTAKNKNGVLILAAKEERKIWITTGYGLEGVLPDGLLGQIIREQIEPSFKQGNFYQGFDKGITAIMDASRGEYKGDPKEQRKQDNGGVPIGIIIFVILIILVAVVRGGGGSSGGGLLNSAGWLALGMLSGSNRRSSGWGGGFGGGSSGGGGFGGFGGGSSGGGGAGGSW